MELLLEARGLWKRFGALEAVKGVNLAREMLAKGTPLEPLGLLLAFLNSLAYFLLGLFLFRLAARRARRLGLLHGY
jgi:ABC-2 type transport system permease protein